MITFGLASKKHRLWWSSAVRISNIEIFFLDCFWKLDYALLMHSDARVQWKSCTSWWAVKLGRNQQMNNIWNSRYLDQLDYLTQCESIAAIFHMGLLKKIQARDWSWSRPQSLNHDPLKQSSVSLCHGTKISCLGVLTRVPITKSMPSFSTSIRRAHYIIVC